jgi:hypothetical protein
MRRMLGISTLAVVLLIVVALLLLGTPFGVYPASAGYWPGGVLGLVLVIILVLIILGRI